MQLTITFNPNVSGEVNDAMRIVSSFLPAEERDAIRRPSAQPLGVVPVKSVDEPQPQVGDNSGSTAADLTLSAAGSAGNATGASLAVAAASAPVATRRGRKSKEVAGQSGESQAAQPTSAPSTDTSTTATTSEPQASAPASSLTLDAVRAKLQAYTVKYQVPAGIELLKKFGAARISELAPEKYADFVKECV